MISLPKINLPSGSSEVSTSFGFDMADNYAFYDRNHNPDINPEYYQHIISTAQKIVIWDPFFMENVDGALFESVKKNDVEIEILTVCKPTQDVQSVNSLRDNIKNALIKVGITNFTGFIYAFKNYKVKDGNNKRLFQCHDRFLLIDDDVAYLVGASMNNQQSSEWNFGIMKMKKNDNQDVYNLIVDKYNSLKSKFLPNINGWKTTLRP